MSADAPVAKAADAPVRKAMVLAAGLGTRLRPLTDRLPKPAVPLCGVAPVRFTLARLAAAGVREAVVNTHWLPERIHEAVGDPAALGLTVAYSHEPEILGTGGGLKKVADRFRDGPFFLVNGKLLFEADLEGLVAFHRAHGAEATMLLRPYPEGATYNPVEIDAEGRVRRLLGRFEWDGPLEKTMFTGVHLLEPALLDELPPDEEVCIIRHAYLRRIAAGRPVHGFLSPAGHFAEPSTPARYLAAVEALLGGRVDLARFPGADPFAGHLSPAPNVWVHPSATVDATATLVGPCWVGADAHVGPGAEVGPFAAVEAEAEVRSGGRVRHAIVWPRAVVRGDERLERVIAVDDLRVPA